MSLDRKTIRIIALILSLCFIAILAVFLILHYLRGNTGLFNFKISKGYISLKKIDYKFYKKGILAYEIFAKSLNYKSKKKNIIKLNAVKIYIYCKNRKPAYIIIGKTGKLNTVSKNVIISGGVSINGSNGMLIKTDIIDYFAKKDEIAAPGGMKIKSKNYFISGEGFIYYVKKKLFVLRKDVHFLSNNANMRRSSK